MYIRAVQVSNGKTETVLINHQLVESHRTEKGPRQRLIMHLGTLDLPRNRWRELAAVLAIGVTGQQMLFPAEPDIQALAKELLAKKDKPACREVPTAVDHKAEPTQAEPKPKVDPNLVTVDLASLNTSKSRSLGSVLTPLRKRNTLYQTKQPTNRYTHQQMEDQ